MEKREFDRIPIKKLPENLKAFMVDVGIGNEIRVETYDASYIGLGISVPASEKKFLVGDNVILRSTDGDFRLIGKIIYKIEKSDDFCRLGLEFRRNRSLKLYRDKLEKLKE